MWLKEIEDRDPGSEAKRSAVDEGAVTFDLKQRVEDVRTTRTCSREQINWLIILLQSGLSAAQRAAQQAARLRTKYANNNSKSGKTGSVLRRDNQYKISKANSPSTDHAAGINQDGTDYSYFVSVELGSKKQQMYMLVDTGAGSSWVMGTACGSDSCKRHDTFGPEDSDTIDTSDEDFNIAYGSGNVEGKLTTDTISVAGMSFKYKFGLASKASDDFSHFAFDGILGLSMGKGASDNFLEALGNSKAVPSSVFGVSLNRASDGTNNGEIKFGGTNPAKYTGDITYTAVGKDGGDWAIPLDDMAYDGKKASVGGNLAYIDTGTSFIFGPEDLVKKFHANIPGAEAMDDASFSVPCDANKPFTVTFSGNDYTISPKDWISPKDGAGKCTSNIYGHEVVQGAWLLGDTFLKNVYAVFDKDKKQIGFAKAAGTPSDPKSDSSSVATKTTTASDGTLTTMTTQITATSGDMNPPRSRPPMGLSGHETQATGSGSPTSDSKPSKTGDSKNSAAGLHARAVQAMSAAGFITVLAMAI